jgi:hypothetical protein
MKQGTLVALLVSLLWAGTVGAQSVYPDRPMRLRVTGTLLPVEEQKRDDLVTVNIFVQDKPWLLRMGKVEELTEMERERAVKDDVLLRQVRFYGPDALMQRLQQPGSVGKVLTIEGRLDTKERRFLVTAVEEATDATPPQRPSAQKNEAPSERP